MPTPAVNSRRWSSTFCREADPQPNERPDADTGPPVPMIGNLPDPLSSFVGRVDEVKELVDDLDRARVITLTGFGGTGKTRLAIQVAQESTDRFADGCWFVDLAAISTSRGVAVAAATAIGVQTETTSSPMVSLVDHLRSRRALVVVDNCEHVVGAAAALVEHARERVSDGAHPRHQPGASRHHR